MKNKILVIDDNPSIRELLVINLTEAGYTALEAESGNKAKEVINGQRPDLILCDIAMPGMDGIEVCKWVRKYSDIPQVPFIFLTAVNYVGTEIKAMRAGGDEYLLKSMLKRDELLRIIKSLVGTIHETRADEQHGSIQGQLSEMSLAEVLQLIMVSRKSGILTVYHKTDTLKIYFNKGAIFHAEGPHVSGIEALRNFSSPNKGAFCFVSAPATAPVTIQMPTLNVIMECFSDLETPVAPLLEKINSLTENSR